MSGLKKVLNEIEFTKIMEAEPLEEDFEQDGPVLNFKQDSAGMIDIAEQCRLRNEIDEKMGFSMFSEGDPKLGWLVNIQPVILL